MSVDYNSRIVAEMSEHTEKIFDKAKEIIEYYNLEHLDKLREKFAMDNGYNTIGFKEYKKFEEDFFNSVKEQWYSEWGRCTGCWCYVCGKNYVDIDTSTGYPNAYINYITNELKKNDIKYSCTVWDNLSDYDELKFFQWYDGVKLHESTEEERNAIVNKSLTITDVTGMKFKCVDYDVV